MPARGSFINFWLPVPESDSGRVYVVHVIDDVKGLYILTLRATSFAKLSLRLNLSPSQEEELVDREVKLT